MTLRLDASYFDNSGRYTGRVNLSNLEGSVMILEGLGKIRLPTTRVRGSLLIRDGTEVSFASLSVTKWLEAFGRVSSRSSITVMHDIVARGGIYAQGDLYAAEKLISSENIVAMCIRGDRCVTAAGKIRAGGSIRSDGDVTAGEDICAERGILVRGSIVADGNIRAGATILCGGELRAGGGIASGDDIRVEGAIESGAGIMAQSSISCMGPIQCRDRVFAGLCCFKHPTESDKVILCRRLRGGTVGYGWLLETDRDLSAVPAAQQTGE